MGSIAGDKVRGTKYDLIAIVRGTKSCCHDTVDKLVTKYVEQITWFEVCGTKYMVQSTCRECLAPSLTDSSGPELTVTPGYQNC